MTCAGSSPSSTQPSASQGEPEPLRESGIVRLLQGPLPRLAQKDHAEEFHHHVGGERGGQREQRRTQRQQHVDEGVRHLVANRKACSSSHSDTKPFKGGNPAIASTPISVARRPRACGG